MSADEEFILVGVGSSEDFKCLCLQIYILCVRGVDRFKLRLVIGNATATVISAYAPQSGLTDEQKDRFYESLLQTTSITNDSDHLIMAGDFKT